MAKNEKNDSILSLKLNIAGIIIFLLFCGFAIWLFLPYIKEFANNPESLPGFISDNLLYSIVVFTILRTIQVVVAIIPGEFLEVVAGVAFGWLGGFLLAILGVAIGSAIIFLIFRKLGKPLIMRFVKKEKLEKLQRFNDHPRRDIALFLIFFIPGLPKDITTYAAAFFDITISRFLIITLIARIPSIVTSTVAGYNLIEGNFTTTILIFVITGIFSIAGFIFSEKILTWLDKRRHK